MNEVVKYQNDLNTATMRTWSEIEMNILFAIVAKIREKSTNNTTLTFEQIKDLANFKKNLTKKEFVAELVNVSKKLATLNYLESSEDEMVISLFVLFQTFTIDRNKETLTVSVHPQFEYVFNKIGMEFTQFELKEFIDVSSTYAKTAYRLLKQYRSTGWWKITIDDFKKLLDVPKSYKSSHIDTRVLTPILEQLGGTDDTAIFKNLKVSKDKKKGRGRGGILTGYTFTFDKEIAGEWIEGKYTSKPDTKKDNLPDWAKDGYQHEEKELDDETRQKLDRRLAEYEKNKHKKT